MFVSLSIRYNKISAYRRNSGRHGALGSLNRKLETPTSKQSGLESVPPDLSIIMLSSLKAPVVFEELRFRRNPEGRGCMLIIRVSKKLATANLYLNSGL